MAPASRAAAVRKPSSPAMLTFSGALLLPMAAVTLVRNMAPLVVTNFVVGPVTRVPSEASRPSAASLRVTPSAMVMPATEKSVKSSLPVIDAGTVILPASVVNWSSLLPVPVLSEASVTP